MNAPATDLFNRADALALLDGDEDLFASIVELFVQESETYCAGLESSLAANDAAALRREAHTVKSMLATFCCEAGRALAMQLEHQAATGNIDGVGELTRQVVSAVRALASELGRAR